MYSTRYVFIPPGWSHPPITKRSLAMKYPLLSISTSQVANNRHFTSSIFRPSRLLLTQLTPALTTMQYMISHTMDVLSRSIPIHYSIYFTLFSSPSVPFFFPSPAGTPKEHRPGQWATATPSRWRDRLHRLPFYSLTHTISQPTEGSSLSPGILGVLATSFSSNSLDLMIIATMMNPPKVPSCGYPP